ncbi:MAG: N-acetyltransferase [Microcella sp.]|uniref:GNAT family N-acetyltransferase n=1 Tax=Microcella sp. TaxID=1913979 RepID=UPI0024CD208C|nr:GNAT family N-acetyltransferase [Microcella sp.]UYN82867.1 MAG: N-acetyltransferase [Microcella sp.]
MLRVIIRELRATDWPSVQAIYQEGIDGGHATFESHAPSWADFDRGHLREARLVVVDEDDAVLGWVAASPVSTRAVYRGVVEDSVYVAAAAQGRGVGGALLRAFIEASEGVGIWTVQASIFPENTASLALHEREGFRVVGRREAIARMTHGPLAGVWRDTLIVERRTNLYR